MITKVRLGTITATPAALDALREAGDDVGYFLNRHANGDWGDSHDRALNDANPDDALSSYRLRDGAKIWIKTDEGAGPRGSNLTTVLTPDDW